MNRTEDMRRMMRRADARPGCPDGLRAAAHIRLGGVHRVAELRAQVCAATGQSGDPWHILGITGLWRGQVDLLYSGGCSLDYPDLSWATSHDLLILYDFYMICSFKEDNSGEICALELARMFRSLGAELEHVGTVGPSNRYGGEVWIKDDHRSSYPLVN